MAKKMKFVVNAETEGFALHAKMGKHELVLDESEMMGGGDTGPNPMQTALTALASCETVTANVVAKEMDFDLQGLTFKVTGAFDPRGFMGDSSVRPYFEEVSVDVQVKTTESDERIKELQAQVEARCPIYTLFNAADVQMNDNWISL